MKNIRFIPIFALMLLLGVSVAAQTNGVTVGFLINGVELEPLPSQPTDPDDQDHVLRVKPNGTVMFRDASTGASADHYRFWDFNGDMMWDTISRAATHVSYAYQKPGFYAVTYCLGHTKRCATRWVYVEGSKATQSKKAKPQKNSKPAESQALDELLGKSAGMGASSAPPPPAPSPVVYSASPPPPPPPPQVEENAFVVEAIEEIPEPVVLSSAPRSMEAPDIFLKTGRAGIPLSKYATAQNCVGKSKSSFTVNLQPKTAMDLVSFVVYASDCGGLNLTISGPEFTETEKIVLSKGKNLIDLEDYDIRLRAGVKYTMTGTGITGLGGCGSSKPPMFEDVSKCTTVASEDHPNLTVDQKKSPVVFELRFLHQ